MGKIWNWIKNRWKEKGTKAAILAVIGGVGSYFGLDLTPEQNLAIVAFLGVIISTVTVGTKTAKAEDRDD